MIYKAFLNRQEITGFPVKGKDTKEIWGGNTLLWRKDDDIVPPVRYGICFLFKKGIYVMDPIGGIVQPPVLTTDEAGYHMRVSDDTILPKKIAYCVKIYRPKEYPDTDVCSVAMGAVSDDDPWIIPHDSCKGQLPNQYSFSGIPVVQKDSDGIYSWNGNYTFMNLHFHYIQFHHTYYTDYLPASNVRKIVTTDGAKLFYDLEEMKAWLKAD